MNIGSSGLFYIYLAKRNRMITGEFAKAIINQVNQRFSFSVKKGVSVIQVRAVGFKGNASANTMNVSIRSDTDSALDGVCYHPEYRDSIIRKHCRIYLQRSDAVLSHIRRLKLTEN